MFASFGKSRFAAEPSVRPTEAGGKLMPRSVALGCLSCFLLSCGQPAPSALMGAEEKARIAEQVDATVRDYVSAIQALDSERMLGFWADVEGFTIAGDGSLIVGFEPWAAQIRALVEATAEVTHIEVRNPQIFVLGRDAASYSMEFEWSMTSREGVTTNASGSWTYVFKRFPEGWRVVHSAGTHIYS